ncbi:Transcriptional regulator [Lactobacillus helsingborgensis]|uniref:TetR/AcrR family transcriptional regulator n=1 Tax=Lactobacillus helsingborgensis TaxID=1218494 RepID=A0A0F4M8U1_9LACO|nr:MULTISPECIES: TetR/AcrR family transcriptional regulator [Lactobacillus]AIS08591.1 Transcriptional regulator, TetR family [Lactobacillus sp. wkB8]AWN32904.1 TetR/AcrR family transcriptional regulator [Lactobacillus helsingborgensis]KJY66201.1 Transcriptional regulator [Lactobacillus helsingborgensis]MBC6356654.1 TetR/AcrR family transcriptional regulator [Lactobacillus helsingborgensis]MCT6828075.1 TetR/AcrR family transcriptional regulator [Lactobacillus helsingborgensis]
MARKKEIGRNKILSIAYKMVVKDGIESLTARNIAKAGHFSTQPLYLEFNSMEDLRKEVLRKIADNLKNNILQKRYTDKPLIDMDLSYIDFAKEQENLFRAMFVDGKFGSKIIADTLIDFGVEKFREQYPKTKYPEDKIRSIIIANWITTSGIASLLVNKIATFTQTQIINVLTAQINDAILNDWLSKTNKVSLFKTGEAESKSKSKK